MRGWLSTGEPLSVPLHVNSVLRRICSQFNKLQESLPEFQKSIIITNDLGALFHPLNCRDKFIEWIISTPKHRINFKLMQRLLPQPQYETTNKSSAPLVEDYLRRNMKNWHDSVKNDYTKKATYPAKIDFHYFRKIVIFSTPSFDGFKKGNFMKKVFIEPNLKCQSNDAYRQGNTVRG